MKTPIIVWVTKKERKKVRHEANFWGVTVSQLLRGKIQTSGIAASKENDALRSSDGYEFDNTQTSRLNEETLTRAIEAMKKMKDAPLSPTGITEGGDMGLAHVIRRAIFIADSAGEK